MNPQRTIEYSLRFAGAFSAWWLLLLLPLALAVGIVLYRRQSRDIEPAHAWGLLVLRALILAVVVLLIFRPSLVRRITATYPARLLLLLDDSASMGVPDPALPEDTALAIARQTRPDFAQREAPFNSQRAEILALERALLRFEHFSRSADRSQDAFWREASRVQTESGTRLDRLAEQLLATGATATPAAPAAPAAPAGAKAPATPAEIAERCRSLKASLEPLFTGEQAPPAEVLQKIHTAINEIADGLAVAQAAADRATLAAKEPATAAALDAIRRAPRLDQIHAWLQQNRESLLANAGGVTLWQLSLGQPKPQPLSELATKVPPVSAGETDLSGTLLRLLQEENPFPLAGVVVFSDGRDLGPAPLESITQAAALRAVPVPIYTVGCGATSEPPDLAVCDAYYPPFAVTGTPIGIRASLKTVVSKPETVELDLLADGAAAPLVKDSVALTEAVPNLPRRLLYTPTAEGLPRLTLQLGGVKEEVVPKTNNSLDVVVRVRPERVRILFLDEKPRWESRFVINILRRLDYLDLNAIVVLAQPEGKLKRGVGAGCWPERADDLALYDLVIVGDLPADRLTADDWQRLADYVQGGGSLALLGTGQTDPLPAAVAAALLPTLPRRAATPPPDPGAILQLTRAGRYHPVTRPFGNVLPSVEATGAERRGPETIGLLQTQDGRPLLSTRFCGKGKTLFLDTDQLWRRLNAVALEAHNSMVIGLVDWAIEARVPAADKPQPDVFRYRTRDTAQLWTAAAPALLADPIVELQCGKLTPLSAPAVRPHPGAVWASAVFPNLPAGDWTFRLRNKPAATDPLRVVDRSRELHNLARDEAFLQRLAESTGGAMAPLPDASRLFARVQPQSHVDRQERIWRLWDSLWVLGALVVLLTVEWVWRKLAGMA